MRDVVLAVAVVAALGGVGWKTAPAVRPPPPPGVEAPTVRDLALASLDDLTLREEAIRVLGFVGLDEDVPILRELVADPRWTAPAARALIDLLGPDALPELEPLLRNRWFKGRRALILALGHATDSGSAEVLVELYTTSTTGWVHYAAAAALEERQEPLGIDPLAETFRRNAGEATRLASYPVASRAREILKDAARGTREPHASHALRALAEAGDPEVVPLLIGHLTGRVSTTRIAALHALGELDDPRVVPAILAFEEQIDSEEEHDAWMHALWEADQPQTHRLALDRLANGPVGRIRSAVEQIPDTVLRTMPEAFIALAKRRPGAIGDTLVAKLMDVEWTDLPPSVLEMARALLPTHDGYAQMDGPTRLLQRFGTPADRARVLAVLTQTAEAGDPRTLAMFKAIPPHQRVEEHVEAVVLLLSHTSRLTIVDRAFGVLKPHLDEQRRAGIALALLDRIAVDSLMRKAMALPAGRTHVEELARSGTRTEQVAAKTALGEGALKGALLGILNRRFGSTAVAPLETFEEQAQAMRSTDRDTIWEAASALGRSSDPRAVDLLVEAVRGGGDRAEGAAAALQMHHTERTLQVVDELFADPDPERRILALSMGFMANPELAFDGLDDEEPEVRESAVPYVANQGSSRAAERLRQALDDDDPEVRAAAAVALKGLGGRHARDVAERIEELEP